MTNNTWPFEPSFSPKENVWFLYDDKIMQGDIMNLKYKVDSYKGKYTIEECYDIADKFVGEFCQGYNTLRENIKPFQIGRTKEELVEKLLKEYGVGQ